MLVVDGGRYGDRGGCLIVLPITPPNTQKLPHKMKDYYHILGIPETADLALIKKAYRQKAFRYHPDRNKAPDANEQFIAVMEAYEVLRDAVRRAEYDALRELFQTLKDEPLADSPEQDQYDQRSQEWAQAGRQKAAEYASINFEEFSRRLLFEVGLRASYIPNLIAILLVFMMAVSILVTIPSAFERSDSVGLFLLLFVIGLTYLGYRLYQVAHHDYYMDRKQKQR